MLNMFIFMPKNVAKKLIILANKILLFLPIFWLSSPYYWFLKVGSPAIGLALSVMALYLERQVPLAPCISPISPSIYSRDLGLCSHTVIQQFSCVRRSYDIDTTSLAIHEACHTYDCHKCECKSATYLHVSYYHHCRPFHSVLPTLICMKSLFIRKNSHTYVYVRVDVTYRSK